MTRILSPATLRCHRCRWCASPFPTLRLRDRHMTRCPKRPRIQIVSISMGDFETRKQQLLDKA